MQALAGSQAKEPASKTARVEVVGFFMHEYFRINRIIFFFYILVFFGKSVSSKFCIFSSKELIFVMDEKENYDIISNNLNKTQQYIKEKI